ncbi:MAG: DUF2478 domain-containing protein [Parvibaculaceae bacterium]
MESVEKTIAAVQGTPSSQVQAMFRSLARRWRPSARIVGLIEEDHGLGKRACSAGRLQSIADGTSYPIFQDLGPGSAACHLDGAGAVPAGEAVRRDVVSGCDLVLLSKFGKLEAGGAGLVPAFAAAIEAGVPVLTSVSPAFETAWARFAGSLFVALPADPQRIEAWWRAVSARRGRRQAGAEAFPARPA